jgi:preprotein translocase subunit SecY|tara:strand:- start:5087 stop:6286 length:1200 start_codon:yes stop_codon:yes gene_type:complete
MRTNKIDSVSNKIRTTIFIIFVTRLGNYIPVPNVDQEYLINILNSTPLLRNFYTSENLVLGIFSLGILPYLNASIMMQLLTSLVPSLEKLQKEEGEAGRREITKYTRYLTLFWAVIESFSIAFALRPILFIWNISICGQIVLSLVTGSMIILWLSEIITEKGIGNGSSLIITANILSGIPNTIKTVFTSGTGLSLSLNFISFTVLITGIIYVQEAVRVIPLVSAKQLLTQPNNQTKTSFLPLKINQGGVMPIIFASTVLTFLTIFVGYIVNLDIFPKLDFAPNIQPVIYSMTNFGLILVFSLFYSNLILNPSELAKDLNKMAVTIPGIRPGNQTKEFLTETLKRLSLLGALFLATIVTIPNIRSSYGFGITSLLILVGVTVDTSRQIQTLLINESYQKN